MIKDMLLNIALWRQNASIRHFLAEDAQT